MKLNQFIYKAGKIANDYCGYYTKRQCVRISANIGKELVDLKRSGKEITIGLLNSVAKKHVPKADVEIITDSKVFEQIAIDSGYTEEIVKKMLENIGGVHFNFLAGKGIYMPNISREKDLASFAHEFEHYMHNEHTFIRKKINQVNEKRRANKAKSGQKKPDDYDKGFLGVKKTFEKHLRNFFGVNELVKKHGYDGLSSRNCDITKFLAGENYKSLTSEKRIDAYIRAISRSLMHPSDEDSFANLLLMQSRIKDESRAYKVSDIVTRYIYGRRSVSRDGFISNIYSRAVKVLKKELWLSLKNLFDENIKIRKTGLPINSYNETRIAELVKQQKTIQSAMVVQKPKPKVIWTKLQ